MEDKPTTKSNRPWGGKWTEQKLEAFEKYVNAYLTIMNKHRASYKWKLIYFDAFAGSGSRDYESEQDDCNQTLLAELDMDETEANLYKGAAERVLNIDQPGFDYYYFIDRDKKANDALDKKLAHFKPDKAKMFFRSGDANEQIAKFADALRKNKKMKALAFLDPFGMQVDWASLEQLKGAGVDLWILVPTGVIVNRLLDRKGKLKHIGKLASFFGLKEAEIREHFYPKTVQQDLFGETSIVQKISQPIKRISELYVKRLQTIFKEVTEAPFEMKNTQGTPIFHFVFASNNSTAKKIASQIIGGIRP